MSLEFLKRLWPPRLNFPVYLILCVLLGWMGGRGLTLVGRGQPAGWLLVALWPILLAVVVIVRIRTVRAERERVDKIIESYKKIYGGDDK